MRLRILLALLLVTSWSSPVEAASGEIDLYLPKVLGPGHPPRRTLDWLPALRLAKNIPNDPQAHPGYTLALQHCVRCHLLPSPSQIPREAWPFVFAWMSNYLGYDNRYGFFEGIVLDPVIPEKPVVNEIELKLLAEYFQVYAVTEQEIREQVPVPTQTTSQFRAEPLKTKIPPGGTITALRFDSDKKQYLIGWANNRSLEAYDLNGNRLFEQILESEPVGIEARKDGYRTTLLGHFLEDRKMGQVVDLVGNGSDSWEVKPRVTEYHRLSGSESADLDGDGIEDLLLLGFGQGEVGKVSILWGDAAGEFGGETELLGYSGAVGAAIEDFNGDGLSDIMILTSQAQQELLLFVNEGNKRRWENKMLQKRFAGFGFTQFSLADMNGDGRKDVVLCNGNNMEIERAPLKAYHGVRILEQGEGATFTERFSYPLFGAWKVIPNDFDLDGDTDLAVIAFNPDWEKPEPVTFVYLENQGGDYEFSPSVLRKEEWGRWITMEMGDVDQDGDQDLILGGGYFPLGIDARLQRRYAHMVNGRSSVVLLKNQAK